MFAVIASSSARVCVLSRAISKAPFAPTLVLTPVTSGALDRINQAYVTVLIRIAPISTNARADNSRFFTLAMLPVVFMFSSISLHFLHLQ